MIPKHTHTKQQTNTQTHKQTYAHSLTHTQTNRGVLKHTYIAHIRTQTNFRHNQRKKKKFSQERVDMPDSAPYEHEPAENDDVEKGLLANHHNGTKHKEMEDMTHKHGA
jgi:hypothetical protein